ncbi:MAG: hypothetical protein ABIG44_16730 [Planctomycetota bacterium]
MRLIQTVLLLSLVSGLGVSVAVAAERPLREAESENQQFHLRIRPGRPGAEAVRGCKAVLYEHSGQGSRARQRWERFLVNDVAPEHVCIRDDGRFVVTLNEFQRGGARHALVIYGQRGEMLRHFVLSDLLERADWKNVSVDKQALKWLSDAKFSFVDAPSLFVITLKHERQIRIDLRTLQVLPSDDAGESTAIHAIPAEYLALLFGSDSAEAAAEPVRLAELSPEERAEAQALAEQISSPTVEAADEQAPAVVSTEIKPDIPPGEVSPPPQEPETEAISPDPVDAEELVEKLAGRDDGLLVPFPDPTEPVDYLAWLNEMIVTDGPSARPDYQAAMDALVSWEGDSELLRAAVQGDPAALGSPEVSAWLDANRQALAYFGDGTRLEFNGWELRSEDGHLISALLPHLSPMRQLSRATIIEGRQLQAAGQVPEAVDKYLDVLSAGAHAGNGPTLIEHLVGIAIQTTAVNALMDVPASENGDVMDYAGLSEQLERTLGAARPLDTPLQAERAMFLDTLQSIYQYDEQSGGYTINEEQARTYLALVSSDADNSRQDVFLERLRSISFEETVAAGNAFYDETAEAFALPFDEATRRLESIEARFNDRDDVNPLLHTLAPAFSRYHFVNTRAEAYRRAARLTTNLQAYRQQHGSYPDSLDAFSGSDFTVDPFTGQVFRYQREADNFVLYSTGRNGVDDGGIHDPKAETNDLRFWPRPR